MKHSFQKRLQDRKEKGSLRSLLSFDDHMIDFWSNDYLGLGKKEQQLLLRSGSGSRLISGNSAAIEAVEHQLAQHFQSEAALMFNSGYDANLGFFGSVPQRGDTVLYDELIHASVRDGMRLSFATHFAFKHNDLVHLEERLQKATGTVFVAVESLYSMDGDFAPLEEIIKLCKQYHALLIVDEAHAGAVFGKTGGGVSEDKNLTQEIFARLYTFGKGFGAHGAVWCVSQEVRSFLINFARSFIYTTALPESFYQHVLQHIQSSDLNEKQELLQRNISFFKALIPTSISAPNSPIQMLAFSELEECLKTAKKLQEQGFGVKAILPPTVSEGQQRLRFCIHAFNTIEEFERLSALLKA